MPGAALTKVETQIGIIKGYADSALAAAETALANLAEINFPDTWRGFSFGGIPVFTPDATPPPGALVVEPAPDIISIVVPTKPDKPDIPSVTLGELYAIVLPDIPMISFPSIDITPPVYNVSAPVPWSFDIGNVVITDDPLLQAAITRLTNNINNGGTGLSADVEAAIWQRDLERNEQQIEDSTDKVTTMWAKKGFSLPDGMLAHSLSEIQKEYMNKMLDRTREISIKQAELEQTNLFKSLELTIKLAAELINMLIRYEELVFKGQEATAKFANEYVDIQLKSYMSKVEAYKAIAQTYEMIIRAELAKVEVYKAQIDAQKVIGEVNNQTVQVYSEQLKATSILMDRYKTEVGAMIAELDVEKVKIEANKLQFDAWAKGVDVNITKYNGETEMFKAGSMVNISTAEFQSNQAQAQAKISLASIELWMRQYEGQDKLLLAKQQIVTEAAKGVATATASMAAGAMAAMSAHASMTYSETQPLEEI